MRGWKGKFSIYTGVGCVKKSVKKVVKKIEKSEEKNKIKIEKWGMYELSVKSKKNCDKKLVRYV